VDTEEGPLAQHFHVPILGVECFVGADTVGSVKNSSSEVSATMGSMGDSSSVVLAMVKSDRVPMLVDGE